VFSFHDIVEPDLIFVAPDQLDILTANNIQGTPAMVVEILSPSTRTRDRQIKRTLYERTGVREYWLVDPELNAVTIHRRAADGSFPLAASLSADGSDTLETPLLPGWSVALTRLFR
jgi:Uma2 family endonuclease